MCLIVRRKKLLQIVLVITALLLIPIIAMQVTDQVNWGLLDFIIAAFLLFSTGATLDLITRKTGKPQTQKVLFAIVLLIFILIWGELAVGIFGTPFAGD